jgi:hypothetical protein
MTALTALVTTTPARAAGPVPFSQAKLATFGTGSEVHLKTLQVGATTVAGVEQGFSGQSVNSTGLSKPINAVTNVPVQPDFSSTTPPINAYGRGSGLEVGVGTSSNAPNQVILPPGVQSQSPPVSAPVSKSVVGLPPSAAAVATANVLNAKTSAAWNTNACPLGQPMAYGEGDAAQVGLLPVNGTSLLSTTGGSGTAAAQSQTYSYLLANPDGSFGVASKTSDILAPISLNLSTLASLQVSIQGTSPDQPVTLLATADGEGHAKVQLLNSDATIVVSLVSMGKTIPLASVSLQQVFGQGGFNLDLSNLNLQTLLGSTAPAIAGPVQQLINTLGLQKAVDPVMALVSKLLDSLGLKGQIHIGAPLYPIQGLPTQGTTVAAAGFDLVSVTLSLGLPGAPKLDLTDLRIGHMEVGASLDNSITCSIPVTKSANPTTVQAGNGFTYNISIPTAANSLDGQACDLVNVSATDKIGVASGSPQFTIVSVSNGGTYDANTQTVTWPSLGNYHPGDPPITLTITASTPPGSPGGVFRDTINAASGVGKCTGGVTGDPGLNGDLSHTRLTGSFTLDAPTVIPNAVATLPRTGSTPVLPWLGAGLLVLAEGIRRLVRRARRPEASS